MQSAARPPRKPAPQYPPRAVSAMGALRPTGPGGRGFAGGIRRAVAVSPERYRAIVERVVDEGRPLSTSRSQPFFPRDQRAATGLSAAGRQLVSRTPPTYEVNLHRSFKITDVS
jgi:hypothetical protein